MLAELTIRDFAIIDQLHLTLGSGFNVLTGETGAGKSIIIDAIGLLLGDRASPDLVRAGQEKALIEGIFALPAALAASLEPLLRDNGLESDGGELSMAREIRRGGRSISRINGSTVNTALLAEIGGALVDIHGQSEHLSLMNIKHHVDLLDRYANLGESRSALARVVRQLNGARRELMTLQHDARELARRVDLLTYQVNEIGAARLAPGEDKALEMELRRLSNAEQLLKLTQQVIGALEDGGDEQRAAVDMLGQASHALGRLIRIDPTLEDLQRQLGDLTEQIVDIGREVRHYGDGVEFNPERLQQTEERLSLIYNLKRKYGESIGDILIFGERAQAELNGITHAGERIEDLLKEEKRLLREIGALGVQMSQARRAAGERLARAVEQELADLRMARASFAVDIRWQESADGAPAPASAFPGAAPAAGEEDKAPRRVSFDSTGLDRVEFLVSANPGEPLRPLARVASGGETARLMLALKTVLSHADETPTLIFDEIDVGIGGRVGAVVGQKLWSLNSNHQVLCVTHLPQLATFGDTHFSVAKDIHDGRTITSVRPLAGAARIEELAQMLGTPTDVGRENARALLADTERIKTTPPAAVDFTQRG